MRIVVISPKKRGRTSRCGQTPGLNGLSMTMWTPLLAFRHAAMTGEMIPDQLY
jgi:hypothetical protein